MYQTRKTVFEHISKHQKENTTRGNVAKIYPIYAY